jgi:hypothetical protein
VSVTGGVKYWIGFCVSGSSGSLAGGFPTDSYFSDATPYASWPPSTVGTLVGGATRAVGSTILIVPATNAGMVAEPQQDGLNTYVFDSTVGHADFYGVASISASLVSTLCVTTRAFAQKSDAGARSGAVQLKSGGTTVQSTPGPLATTFAWNYRTDLVDPATGAAWTTSGVNNAQIGPILTA